MQSVQAVLFIASMAAGVAAQADELEPPAELEPVVVTATRVERLLQETPAAVSVVDEQTVRDGRQRLQLDEALTRVPGLFLQNRYNFAQGQRIAARGFGARAPFGVRGIRIRVDGFPETLPDGQSAIDAVDLDAARRIEVVRGPASVLYGNASGGVIAIDTDDGRHARRGVSLRTQFGSHGFAKYAANSAADTGRWFHHASLSHFDFDGYREQSAVRKTLFHGTLGYRLDETRDLSLVATVMDLPRAQDPGGLTRMQVEENRRQATAMSRNLDAGQVVQQQRLGVSYRDAGVAGGQLAARAFYTRRDFEQQLPFPGASRPSFDRDFFGVGVDYAGERPLGAWPLRYVIGAEVDRQQDERLRERVNVAGEVTGVTQDERQQATAAGLFVQGDLALREHLTFSLGARLDRLHMSIRDRFTADGDDSGRRVFDEFSISTGVLWRVVPAQHVYANLGTSFESPTFTEFASPDGSGGFNPAIRPQRAVNRELGWRGDVTRAVAGELTLFSVRVRDEITPFELDGRTFFENAARTRRDGAELALRWTMAPNLVLTGAYTFARYRFARFGGDGDGLAGNRLPGLPRHLVFTEVAWRGAGGGFAAVDGLLVGAVFAENENLERVSPYAVASLRAGRRWAMAAGRGLELFGGINNLLDRDYFANVRINANADRPLEQRGFFEPAPARHLYAGVTASF